MKCVVSYLALNSDSPFNKTNLILEAGETRACTAVCSVVETFMVSLERSADLDSRVRFASTSSVVTVTNTLGKDGINIQYSCV